MIMEMESVANMDGVISVCSWMEKKYFTGENLDPLRPATGFAQKRQKQAVRAGTTIFSATNASENAAGWEMIQRVDVRSNGLVNQSMNTVPRHAGFAYPFWSKILWKRSTEISSTIFSAAMIPPTDFGINFPVTGLQRIRQCDANDYGEEPKLKSTARQHAIFVETPERHSIANRLLKKHTNRKRRDINKYIYWLNLVLSFHPSSAFTSPHYWYPGPRKVGQTYYKDDHQPNGCQYSVVHEY